MPRVLVLHEILLALLQHLEHQTWDIRLVAEVRYGREECFKVEDDASGQRQAAERLPVDTQVNAAEVEVRRLEVAVFLVWVAGWHVQGLVDFKAPATALDGFRCWHFGEESRISSQ